MSQTNAGFIIYEGVAQMVDLYPAELQDRMIVAVWRYCNDGISFPDDLRASPFFNLIQDQLDSGMLRSIKAQKTAKTARAKAIREASESNLSLPDSVVNPKKREE